MMMPITRHDAQTIAHDVHRARPDWDPAGIIAALHPIRDRGTPDQLRAVALTAAADPRNRTPAVIPLTGPHWHAAHTPDTTPRTKCHTHLLENPCRSCRADALHTGTETPTRTRTRTQAPTHTTPMPDWLRATIASRRHNAQEEPR